ncbi:hypothetical protein L593_08890 [Salinarchaeum sp. Harcht-Bsk1]|uniref:hypothetical protein n=1 Tax=Salinarchaeum sp. Harcht-Bsk1 TaxID=1333523 RepID=UPI0003422A8D|nr:hypothetical protein [Salinarchaeum sp. Harcht-Bsk1]AGN01723.1 hypothetical protein L593_08890 [Salinarchaeum sp. Harcht-Bsk1]
MRLRQPTDFLILEALHTYGRNVATNLAKVTGKSRKNVNNRLPVLADYGLARKVGPAKQSGLYEITEEGRAAVDLRTQYDETDDFEALIEQRLENTTSDSTTVAARGEVDDEDGDDADLF